MELPPPLTEESYALLKPREQVFCNYYWVPSYERSEPDPEPPFYTRTPREAKGSMKGVVEKILSGFTPDFQLPGGEVFAPNSDQEKPYYLPATVLLTDQERLRKSYPSDERLRVDNPNEQDALVRSSAIDSLRKVIVPEGNGTSIYSRRSVIIGEDGMAYERLNMLEVLIPSQCGLTLFYLSRGSVGTDYAVPICIQSFGSQLPFTVGESTITSDQGPVEYWRMRSIAVCHVGEKSGAKQTLVSRLLGAIASPKPAEV
jgi:hypothetical protein